MARDISSTLFLGTWNFQILELVVVELFRPQKGAISGLEIDLLMGNRKAWGEGGECSSSSDAVYPVLFQWPESPALSQMGGKSLRRTL